MERLLQLLKKSGVLATDEVIVDCDNVPNFGNCHCVRPGGGSSNCGPGVCRDWF